MSEQMSLSLELANIAAMAAQSKIAKDIILIDLQHIEFAVTDYFLICSCGSEMQADAVKTAIERAAKDAGFGRARVEGATAKEWILLDYFNVVIHIMIEKSRSFYKIEKIWADGDLMIFNDADEFEKFEISKINSLYTFVENDLPESLPEDFWEKDEDDDTDESDIFFDDEADDKE